MSRRHRRPPDPATARKRRIPLYCTGNGTHDRWNVGHITVWSIGDPEQILYAEFHSKTDDYRHEWNGRGEFSEAARTSQNDDGSPFGIRHSFDCGRCNVSIPIRPRDGDRSHVAQSAAPFTEVDVSVVDIRGFLR